MHRSIALPIIAAGLAIPGTALATNPNAGEGKESVCHRTGNGSYVLIPPAKASSHIATNGEKVRGHEGDYLSTDGKCGTETPPVIDSKCVDNHVVVIVNGQDVPTTTICEFLLIREVEGPERVVTVQGPVVEKVVTVLGPERIIRLPRKIKRVVRYRYRCPKPDPRHFAG